MANTKSAERRARTSAQRHQHNRGIKSRLHTLEKNYLGLVSAGKREDAVNAFQAVASAFDKAAKNRVVHKATADRKKSRLAARLNRMA